ncbi:MAG: ankyrin repeat domain-containing protein [Gammaproteobacteria bacterium]|nr:ankyrin repeat domain-containing protein [Gammaproteobacteria bacterium]
MHFTDKILSQIEIELPLMDIVNGICQCQDGFWGGLSNNKNNFVDIAKQIYQIAFFALSERWLLVNEASSKKMLSFLGQLLNNALDKKLNKEIPWYQSRYSEKTVFLVNPFWQEIMENVNNFEELHIQVRSGFMKLESRIIDELSQLLTLWLEDVNKIQEICENFVNIEGEQLRKNLELNLQNKDFYFIPLQTLVQEKYIEKVRELDRDKCLFHLYAEQKNHAVLKQLKLLIEHLSGSYETLRQLFFLPIKWQAPRLSDYLRSGIENHAYETVLFCLELGVDPHARTNTTQKTFLHIAAAMLSPDILQELIAHGLDVNEKDASGQTPLHFAIKSIIALDVSNRSIRSKNIKKVINALVNSGALCLEPDEKGKTPWELLIYSGLAGYIDLLFTGNESALASYKNAKGCALHWAVEAKQIEMYDGLMLRGFNPELVNGEGKTPLQCITDNSLCTEIENLNAKRNFIISQRVDIARELFSHRNEIGLDQDELAKITNDILDPNINGTVFFNVAEIFERIKQWNSAVICCNIAVFKGEQRAVPKRLELEERKKIEKNKKIILNQDREEIFLRHFHGQPILQKVIGDITHPHVVNASYQRLYLALSQVNWFEESPQTLKNIQSFLAWIQLSQTLQGKTHWKDDSNKIRAQFALLLIKTQARFDTQPRMRWTDKNDPFFQARLYQYYLGQKIKNEPLISEQGSIKHRVLYSIVFPYVIRKAYEWREIWKVLANKQKNKKWEVCAEAAHQIYEDYLDQVRRRYSFNERVYLDSQPFRGAMLYSLFTGRVHLSKEAGKRLIPKSGRIDRENEKGAHVVLAYQGMHYKKLDTMSSSAAPGIEYAIDALHYAIAQQGTPPTTLIKVYRGEQSHAYQVSKTVEGLGLDSVLQFYPQDLDKLDRTNYSAMIILSLLTRPRDGKGDNYMVRLIGQQGTLSSLQLFSIDHDCMFGIPLLRIGNRARTEVQTILYLLRQMNEPIDAHFVASFLTLSPERICLEWLGQLYGQNMQYETLIREGVLTKEEAKKLQLPIQLPAGFIEQLYANLITLKGLFHRGKNMTHHKLLSIFYPALGRLYRKLRESEGSILDKMARIWNKDLDLADFEIDENDINEAPEWNRKEKILRPKITIQEAGEALLKVLRFTSMNSLEAVELFSCIEHELHFVRVLTIWDVGYALRWEDLHKTLLSFPHLEHVILQNVYIKNPQVLDILKHTYPAITFSVLQEEQQSNCMSENIVSCSSMAKSEEELINPKKPAIKQMSSQLFGLFKPPSFPARSPNSEYIVEKEEENFETHQNEHIVPFDSIVRRKTI